MIEKQKLFFLLLFPLIANPVFFFFILPDPDLKTFLKENIWNQLFMYLSHVDLPSQIRSFLVLASLHLTVSIEFRMQQHEHDQTIPDHSNFGQITPATRSVLHSI